MIYRRNSKITVDGEERCVNIEELSVLTGQYLPQFSEEEKDKFIDEVIFRIQDGEYESDLLAEKSVEAAYFAACYAYVADHSLDDFLWEFDDGKIFDYLGAEFEDSLEK